ncbi:hypothetical protein ACTI_61670 [Actinoplanes sp. OR16]|uniref:DUF4129 domain-containing protein n=1 Tax=Actinoplanes sp. OR16 TaxID=946334 RepID=UPI000F6FBEE7|nr:DUF4129 domain-containing protein [Actinoplanes sp. OR16]BBH69482.1 hypothetical protein ACTI_61670 [Actinoplanes sp. OR16]
MSRRYDEWIADLFDVVPGRTVLLLLFLATLTGSLLWYSFPVWIPRGMPRISLRLPGLPRWRRRRRPAPHPEAETQEIKTPSPVRPEAPLTGQSADVLASQGRYDEAIRQRMRDTVTDLTRAGVVAPEPGTTAAELADAAAGSRPGIAPAMDAATALFSEVWYGDRPARAEHDEHMRRLTDEVRTDVGGAR